MASSSLAPPPAAGPHAAHAVGLRLSLVCLFLLSMSMGPAFAEAPPWRWPLPPPHQVTAPFDAPADRYSPGHRGIDIAVPASGAAVRAVAPGTVRFSGMVAGRGVVSVTHAEGIISTYEPVAGTVAAGEQVAAGSELGTMEGESELSHCPGTVCLHLGARRGEDYIDPMLLLGGRGPSVLLPWTGGPGQGGQVGGDRGDVGDRGEVGGVRDVGVVGDVGGVGGALPATTDSATGRAAAGQGAHGPLLTLRRASLA